MDTSRLHDEKLEADKRHESFLKQKRHADQLRESFLEQKRRSDNLHEEKMQAEKLQELRRLKKLELEEARRVAVQRLQDKRLAETRLEDKHLTETPQPVQLRFEDHYAKEGLVGSGKLEAQRSRPAEIPTFYAKEIVQTSSFFFSSCYT